MGKRVLPACLCLLVLLTTGCNWRPFRRSADDGPPPPAEEPREVDPELEALRAEVEKLEGENRLLSAKVDELKARESMLADRLRALQFANRQLAMQIETLSKAPAERDAYKAKAERLAIELRKLEEQFARLHLLVPPSPTTKPAPDAPAP